MLYLVLFNLCKIWSVKVPCCGLFHGCIPEAALVHFWKGFRKTLTCFTAFQFLFSGWRYTDIEMDAGGFLYHWNGKSCRTALITTNILHLFLSDFRGDPEQRLAVLLQPKPSTTWLSIWSMSTSHICLTPNIIIIIIGIKTVYAMISL